MASQSPQWKSGWRRIWITAADAIKRRGERI
jgi:hypothetical protein